MRPASLAVLLVQVLAVMASAQDAQEAKEPKRLPAKVMQSWERFEKQVQKNRELYDKANEKALAGFQRELERMNPPVEVDDLVRQFQQEAIVQLDVDARPPAPPPPDQAIVVFNGHRYKLFLESLTSEEAKERCEAMGGNLLTIETRDEQAFVHQALLRFREQKKDFPGNASVWLGLLHDKRNRKWVDRNGVAHLYQNWEPLQPKDNHDVAGMFVRHGRWFSFGKETKLFFICEWDN